VFVPRFRPVVPGIESFRSSFSLPRHRHLGAYATVVLAGRFEESGYAGRIRATAGDVLVHPVLDCHANRTVSSGVTLIRLDWSDATDPGGLFRLEAVDSLARTAARDARQASRQLEELLSAERRPAPGRQSDWPDALAQALAADTSLEIGAWAFAHGLARETVSRGFFDAYGISPVGFRGECRARAAWLRIVGGPEPLSAIAAETGFADQAHMTRWVRRISGATPALWRRGTAAH
jgi:AraC-like DNA-binding protein